MRSDNVTSPLPSMFIGRAWSASWSGCKSANRSMPSSNESSIVTILCSGGTSLINARRSVVFPDPVPPEITIFRRAATAATKNWRSGSSSIPRATNSSRLESSKRCRRMTRLGRRETSITAKSREPSAICRFSSGLPASNRRSELPVRAAIRRINSTSALSESTIGPRRSLRPSRSRTHTESHPRMWMSVTSSSSSNGCKRPKPSTSDTHRAISSPSISVGSAALPSSRRIRVHSVRAACRAKPSSSSAVMGVSRRPCRSTRSSASSSPTTDTSRACRALSSTTRWEFVDWNVMAPPLQSAPHPSRPLRRPIRKYSAA